MTANFTWVGSAAAGPPNSDFTWQPPVAGPVSVVGTIVLGGPVVSGVAIYNNRLPRSVTAAASAAHQDAAPAGVLPSSRWQQSVAIGRGGAAGWQSTSAREATPVVSWQKTGGISGVLVERWRPADRASVASRIVYQVSTPVEVVAAAAWQVAALLDHTLAARHQVGTPARVEPAVLLRQGSAMSAGLRASHQVATPAFMRSLVRWQEARPIPTGLSVTGGGGVVNPPRVVDMTMVFACPRYAGGPVELIFGRVCGVDQPTETIVVPIRSVYMTVNNFSLFRVDTSQLVPATSMSLSLDVDSWTWNCSFSVAGGALSTVERNSSGDPVILQTSINGTPIRFIVEKISRERSFGSSQLRVQGRGIAAELDSPFAPIMSFGNTEARTARQLLDEILMFNGVSIGWDFGTTAFTDWLVPAGVFSHTGTYISALNAVVGSIGGYIQPHNTNRQLDVLLRYPTPAWGWSTAIPDLVLPSAVTSQEGIEWLDKPDYNRVFVHGQEGGIAGRYSRAGTAGDNLAPAVVDPLITHADAVRQRGRAILSDTGRIANVTLRLPVLAETGIIKPGRLVEYADGPVSRIGMSRSVAIDVSLPTIYQTIQVETHVD